MAVLLTNLGTGLINNDVRNQLSVIKGLISYHLRIN